MAEAHILRIDALPVVVACVLHNGHQVAVFLDQLGTTCSGCHLAFQRAETILRLAESRRTRIRPSRSQRRSHSRIQSRAWAFRPRNRSGAKYA